MSEFEGEIGQKQERAILALLSSRNVEEAARVVDVDPRTLYRWMKEPAFAAACREARRASFSQAVARLQQMAGAAVTMLGKVLVDPSTPPSTKIRAAECVLEHAIKTMELEDLEKRIAELERTADVSNLK